MWRGNRNYPAHSDTIPPCFLFFLSFFLSFASTIPKISLTLSFTSHMNILFCCQICNI